MLGSKLNVITPEWIDVVFAGRNKAYGAYELRKTNAGTTNRALIFGALFFFSIISAKTIANRFAGFIPKAPPKVKITGVVLAPPPIDHKLPPPPPPEPPRPREDHIKFLPPVVTPDHLVHEAPPTTIELQKADPGQETIKGDITADVHVDEPVGTGEKTKAITEDDNVKPFETVEVAPTFPGGIEKFYAYLQKTMKYPAVDRENNVTGKVYVKFVVERDGSLTDIEALRSPSQTLADEAIRVVKGSIKWNAGIQNGRKVRSYFTVPINFTLGDQ